MTDDDPQDRITIEHHRSVRILGTDDKPAVEMANVNGEVKITVLPRNGSKRMPVHFTDLQAAVVALGKTS